MTPTEPGFRAFSAPHVIVIVLSIALPLFLAAAFHRTRSRVLDRFVSISLAGLLVFNYLGYAVYLWLGGVLEWEKALPFQLCDWTMIAVVVALLTGGRRSWLEVAYFWGIGGSLQAILTPNLQFGFPDVRFFSFFIDHGAIVAGILYLMITRKFRPTIESIWRTLAWSEIYLVVALFVNHLTGANYGFLTYKPQAASLLSLLSDWRPLYLLQMNGLALFFFALLYVPFAIYDAVRRDWSASPATKPMI